MEEGGGDGLSSCCAESAIELDHLAEILHRLVKLILGVVSNAARGTEA
jgi:hypothetical protein